MAKLEIENMADVLARLAANNLMHVAKCNEIAKLLNTMDTQSWMNSPNSLPIAERTVTDVKEKIEHHQNEINAFIAAINVSSKSMLYMTMCT